MKNVIRFAFVITLFCARELADDPSQHQSNYTEKIDAILSIMTLDEKLGQLNLPAAGDITTGRASNSNISQSIRKGQVGGLFNLKTAEKIREVQRIAVEESRLKIPILFGMDVIHGYKTVFPIPLALSCTWDMEMIEQSAKIAAIEASADGIAWTFSPMVDLARDPRWGRIAEGVGEDPYLGSEIAKAMVRGYQGDDLSENNTMLACIKHMALHGASEADDLRFYNYNLDFVAEPGEFEVFVGGNSRDLLSEKFELRADSNK